MLLSLHRGALLCWVNMTARHRHRPQNSLIPVGLQTPEVRTRPARTNRRLRLSPYLDNVIREAGAAALQDSSADLDQRLPQEELGHQLRRVQRALHIP